MVHLISEVIPKEYFLGDQEELRFGRNRLPVEELPDGMFFIRVRTGGRDCHFQFSVVVSSDSFGKQIKIASIGINATEIRTFIRVHSVEYGLDSRPVFRPTFSGIKSVGFLRGCISREAGLLDYTKHLRLKRLTNLVGDLVPRPTRELNESFIAHLQTVEADLFRT